jgi:hypothetical protein
MVEHNQFLAANLEPRENNANITSLTRKAVTQRRLTQSKGILNILLPLLDNSTAILFLML